MTQATHRANSTAVLRNTAVTGVYLCKGLSVSLDVVSAPKNNSNGLRPGVAVVQLLAL